MVENLCVYNCAGFRKMSSVEVEPGACTSSVNIFLNLIKIHINFQVFFNINLSA